MNIKNLKALSDSVVEEYKNFSIAEVNDHCLRLAVNTDRAYEWHRHPESEELFVVLEGQLTIEFKNENSIHLKPGDFFSVPKNKTHRTIASGRTVNLCFEAVAATTVFE